MTLTAKAQVAAAPNFLENLNAAGEFFRLQDAGSAGTRFRVLKNGLAEMTTILGWSPASGRPARFLDRGSPTTSRLNDEVLRLAEQAGLPYLREYIVGRHIVLYAHSEELVVLLALKHQLQLAYGGQAQ